MYNSRIDFNVVGVRTNAKPVSKVNFIQIESRLQLFLVCDSPKVVF